MRCLLSVLVYEGQKALTFRPVITLPPVILHPKDERKWLDNDLPLSDVTSLLKPFPAEFMNAHPISIKIKDPKNKTKDLLIPIGEQLSPEYDIKVKTGLRLQGMGSSKGEMSEGQRGVILLGRVSGAAWPSSQLPHPGSRTLPLLFPG